MEDNGPGTIAFQNPIDPAAPPVDVEAAITMRPSTEGGLKQPLALPSPSLVFRVPDSDPVLGYTAVIQDSPDLNQLVPGSGSRAHVVFIGVPRHEVSTGRMFALWHGRDVGSATIVKVISD